jgi:hypothetical protein
MFPFLKTIVNLRFFINPFFLYCIAFLVAILLYMLGWSRMFSPLSPLLILFIAITFVIFIFAGLYLERRGFNFKNEPIRDSHFTEVLFGVIILLGVMNVAYMGYLPLADHTHDYRKFGMPVVDPLFNTLSIFFALIMVHSFLDTHKNKCLIYFLIVLIIQVLLYRRSTIIWIILSSSILYLVYIKKIQLLLILGGILLVPVLSYLFGLYGNTRSNLSETFVLNELGASDSFKNSGLSHNHYMTYLYIASPLANLQTNIDQRSNGLKKGDFKDFMFYCLIPESITLRLEKSLQITKPECYLISPNLIVGTLYMVAFYTLGWTGMILMFLTLVVFILLNLFIIRKYDEFALEGYSLLSAFVCLLIFSNFMNRLDVILLLFVYPVIFHLIISRSTVNKKKLNIIREK